MIRRITMKSLKILSALVILPVMFFGVLPAHAEDLAPLTSAPKTTTQPVANPNPQPATSPVPTSAGMPAPMANTGEALMSGAITPASDPVRPEPPPSASTTPTASAPAVATAANPPRTTGGDLPHFQAGQYITINISVS